MDSYGSHCTLLGAQAAATSHELLGCGHVKDALRTGQELASPGTVLNCSVPSRKLGRKVVRKVWDGGLRAEVRGLIEKQLREEEKKQECRASEDTTAAGSSAATPLTTGGPRDGGDAA
ncbi:hypothetical protein PVAP13_8KG296000 [Panicum virgatum]|uniref:Uncharacterized protein n=1 Tax=Panicum virgatum TaxID=38727 RepID=A0A8T0PNA6_PANVG|nr:hypothetical protein PVAP13_8KG296000 [Panicum virgatum]